jgi:LysR family transcriptional regulator, hydrogen peroxide-inducible genes activator
MELDQLRYFLQVAERGNFTRAAQDLRVSQPALSRSIQKLEEELGQPLFERQTRNLALTDSGNLLQSRARQILTLVDDTKAEITDDGQTGRLRVAAIPTIAPYFLPEVLQTFGKTHPRATVIVQEDTTENLIRALTEGAVDVAILALPLETQYMETEELFEEELLLLMSADHPLTAKKQIRLNDIESLPFVLLGEAHCLSDSIISFCRQKSFHPVSVERTSQLAMVQELVSLNHGISMVPAMAQKLDTCSRRVYRSLSGIRPFRKIAMASNPYRFQSLLLKSFMKQLRISGQAGS